MSSSHITTMYSAPRRPPAPMGPRVWAGAVMLLCSVMLVGMGGCFMIGILGIVRPELFVSPGVAKPASLPPEDVVLMLALYVLAFATFLGAFILFIVGVRGLWRVLRTDADTTDI